MKSYEISQEAHQQIIDAGKVVKKFIEVMSADFDENVYSHAMSSQKYFESFLKRKENLILSKDSISDLHNMRCYIFNQLQAVNGTFKKGGSYEKAINMLDGAKLMLENAMSHIWDEQDEELDSKIEFFNEIQYQNKFMSSWSDYDLFETSEINNKCKLVFSAIEYHGKSYKTSEFLEGHEKTWLNLWAFIEDVMKMSGDRHHIFIESLEDIGSGTMRLYTGS